MHKSCTLGFRGTRVSYQFNIRHYVCRNSTTGTFLYDILLNPGFQDNCHYHAISKTTDDQKFGEKLSLPKGRLGVMNITAICKGTSRGSIQKDYA